MKKTAAFIVILFIVGITQAKDITLVKKGKPASAIIIPDNASAAESKAARVLQDYLQQISGAKVDIRSDMETAPGTEILIGKVRRPEAKDISTTDLAKDGFILQSIANKLLISGGTDKGVLYGVYALLEKYLGCRRYSSKVSYIPKMKTITLGPVYSKEIPSFEFRRIEYKDANAGDFADWNRVTNGREWGTWCHTFIQLLSPKEYGESHPEYFSFYNGSRHPENTPTGVGTSQLCLSNPEVLEIVSRNLKARMERNPEAKYWSVSQNDNVNYCRCPECSRLDAQYAASAAGDVYATGTMRYASTGMGSMMYFINELAERFPDKIISTLAYQYTRRPPENIVPSNNINIMLCSIESPRDIPMEIGDPAFAKDLAGWARLSKDILVWDYTIQFRNLLAPFPNLRTLQPNVQFLRKNGVTALFEQGNRQWGGEFAELRAYLLTKLMWNTEANTDEIMDDFLSGYYGKAGKYIRRYVDIMHDKMEQTKTRLTIFGSPAQAKETFLSDSLIKVYNQLFDKAEKAVKKSPEVLDRVKTARLPLYYAMLEIAKNEKTGSRGAYTIDPLGVQKANPQIVDILNKFVSQCIATGVPRIAEWNTTPQDYLAVYMAFLEGRPAPPVQRFN